MRFYSPQLDGLRFCAALLVFFHHSPLVGMFEPLKAAGWVGVDLFLCISAFLLTRLILIEHQQTGEFSIKNFYIRRALRIWPLYFGYATAASVVSLAIGRPSPGEVFAWWASHLSFTNNLLTAGEGYSTVYATAHLWTISLEEQAYLIIPLALAAAMARDFRPARVVRFAAAAIAALILARAAFVIMGPPPTFIWVLPLRADAFIIGLTAAVLAHHGRLIGQRWMLFAGLGLLAVAAPFPPINESGAYQIMGFTATAVACTAIVLAIQSSRFEHGLLASRPMRYLGKISFGFYVFHVAAIDLTLSRVDKAGLPEWIVTPVAFALTVAVASASYALWERPFLRIKEKFARIPSRPV